MPPPKPRKSIGEERSPQRNRRSRSARQYPPLSAADAAKTVDWFDDSNADKITGTLTRVDCTGKQLKLLVKSDDGKVATFLVPDTQQFEIKNGETLACGPQKPRRVTVSYKASKTKALSNEAIGLEFAR